MEEKPIYKSNQRKARIRSCLLKLDDLKRFCNELQKKVDEAFELEIKYYESFLGRERNPADKEKDIQQIKDAFKLPIQIFGSKGEYLLSTDDSIFDEQKLPSRIDAIIFDSVMPFEFKFRLKPQNGLKIYINHLKTDILEFGTPQEPGEFENFIEVSGSNDTWVHGVFGEVQDFFRNRSAKRNWLHSKKAYDILLWIVFWPLAFWLLFRFSQMIYSYLPTLSIIPSIGIHVYFIAMSLLVFRLILNYGKWVFPLIEVQLSKEDKRIKHRYCLWTILSGIGIAFLVDIIKYLIK